MICIALLSNFPDESVYFFSGLADWFQPLIKVLIIVFVLVFSVKCFPRFGSTAE